MVIFKFSIFIHFEKERSAITQYTTQTDVLLRYLVFSSVTKLGKLLFFPVLASCDTELSKLYSVSYGVGVQSNGDITIMSR